MIKIERDRSLTYGQRSASAVASNSIGPNPPSRTRCSSRSENNLDRRRAETVA